MTTVHPAYRNERSSIQPDYFAFGARTTAAFARPDVLERVTRSVNEGRSVEIVGPRSSGRTELLRRVQLDLALNERIVIPISGVEDATPLEAARLGLPSVERSGLLQRGITTPLLHHAYEKFIGSRPTVILVDDADQLDQASWALLESIHRSMGIPLVTVSRPYTPHGMPRQTAIRVAQPATRVPLEALSLDDTRAIIENRLGGSAAPEMVSRIHTKSAGQPGVALALLEAAYAAGYLRNEGDVWIASSRLWAPGANATFEAILSDLAPESQDALEMLSIAGVTDLATAESLIGAATLEALDGYGMIRIIATAEHTRVAVNPPGIAEYFLHLEPSVRRHRLVEKVTGVLSERHADDELDYVDVIWRHHDESASLPLRTPMEMPHIVRMFTEDHQSHRLVALREWHSERSFETAIASLLSELTGTPDAAVLDELIEHALTAHGDPEKELPLRYLRSRAVLARGGNEAAVCHALVEGVRPDFPYAEALDTLQYATRLEFSGVDPDAEARLRDRIGEGLNGQVASVVLALHYVLSGRAENALPLLDDASHAMSGHLNTSAQILYGLALQLSGRQRAAAEWSTAHLEQAIADIDRTALAGHAYVAALALTSHSRFDEANDVASLPLRIGISTMTLLSSPDRATLMLMSVLAGYSGHASSANALANAAARRGPQGCGLPFADLEWRRATAQYIDGDRAAVQGTLEDIIARAEQLGHRTTADHALMLSMFASYDRDTAERIRPRIQSLGGELALTRMDAHGAIDAGSGDGVMEASARLAGLHAPRAAAKFYSQAARLYREAGMLDDAAVARAAIHSLTGAGGPRPETPSPRALTAREAQVVRYIADGLTNGQIANRLVLSVRTIESHINRISRKTGAAGRHEIAKLARA